MFSTSYPVVLSVAAANIIDDDVLQRCVGKNTVHLCVDVIPKIEMDRQNGKRDQLSEFGVDDEDPPSCPSSSIASTLSLVDGLFDKGAYTNAIKKQRRNVEFHNAPQVLLPEDSRDSRTQNRREQTAATSSTRDGISSFKTDPSVWANGASVLGSECTKILTSVAPREPSTSWQDMGSTWTKDKSLSELLPVSYKEDGFDSVNFTTQVSVACSSNAPQHLPELGRSGSISDDHDDNSSFQLPTTESSPFPFLESMPESEFSVDMSIAYGSGAQHSFSSNDRSASPMQNSHHSGEFSGDVLSMELLDNEESNLLLDDSRSLHSLNS